jgi:hypothetical protein
VTLQGDFVIDSFSKIDIMVYIPTHFGVKECRGSKKKTETIEKDLN